MSTVSHSMPCTCFIFIVTAVGNASVSKLCSLTSEQKCFAWPEVYNRANLLDKLLTRLSSLCIFDFKLCFCTVQAQCLLFSNEVYFR